MTSIISEGSRSRNMTVFKANLSLSKDTFFDGIVPIVAGGGIVSGVVVAAVMDKMIVGL